MKVFLVNGDKEEGIDLGPSHSIEQQPGVRVQAVSWGLSPW